MLKFTPRRFKCSNTWSFFDWVISTDLSTKRFEAVRIKHCFFKLFGIYGINGQRNISLTTKE